VPPAPFSIGAPKVRPDVFSMRTSRQPEATITLSNGKEYNNHTAMGLLQLIKRSGKMQTELRVQLYPHDINALEQFVRFFKGGKKKNGLRRTLNDGSHRARPHIE